jgi:hypothetical protein
MVEALREVFAEHPDPLIRTTKIGPELPMIERPIPRSSCVTSIVVYAIPALEITSGCRSLPRGTSRSSFRSFVTSCTTAILSLRFWRSSSKDRDFLADALVQTIGMSESEHYTKAFLIASTTIRIRRSLSRNIISSISPPTNSQELGDQEGQAPWMEDDLLVYSCHLPRPHLWRIL